MALELVTGYWGMEHVTAEQDADLNAGIIGSGNYVLNIGEKMRAEAVSANQVRIFDGIFMAYGRQCILGDGEYEDITIENGTPGLLRNDMIVVKYKKDEESGKENVTFAVLKGETGSVAKDPVPNRQDIRSGAFESEVPMYRVKINGLAIEKIEPLYSIPMTNDDLSNRVSELDYKRSNISTESSVEVNSNHNVVCKSGKIVYYKLQLTAKKKIVYGNKIAQFPNFALPSENVPFFTIALTGSDSSRVVGNVRTTGEVIVYDTIPLNANVVISGTYITNN